MYKSAVVLGADGLLGSAICPTLTQNKIAVHKPNEKELDIRDFEALQKYFDKTNPGIVYNLAAFTQVDDAQENTDMAFAVNAIGAHNISLACAQGDIALVHVSTDYVFDGLTDKPYKECDPTGFPPSEYGRSKLQGEIFVRQSLQKHYIVRVAVLFGAGRKCFVDWVLENANPEKPLTIIDDRFVSPTWTNDAAKQIFMLSKSGYYGTYHTTGHGVTNWYDIAKKALQLTNKNTQGIVAVKNHELKSKAPRAPFTALDNYLLKIRSMDTMMHWEQSLEKYIEQEY